MGLRTVIPMAMAVVMVDQLLRKRRLVLPKGFAIWAALPRLAAARGLRAVRGRARCRARRRALAAAGLRLPRRVVPHRDRRPALDHQPDASPSCRRVALPAAGLHVRGHHGRWTGRRARSRTWSSPRRWRCCCRAACAATAWSSRSRTPRWRTSRTSSGDPRHAPRRRSRSPTPGAATSPSTCPSSWSPGSARAGAGRSTPRRWSWSWLAIPIVYSLNRGLWVSLVLGVVGVVLLAAAQGQVPPRRASRRVLVVVTIAFFLQPARHDLPGTAGAPAQQRPARRAAVADGHQHGRGLPVVGFGSTRDVQGSFSSIAARRPPTATPAAYRPLGTQGHLWGVIFGQGCRRGTCSSTLLRARALRAAGDVGPPARRCAPSCWPSSPADLRLRHPRHAAADGDDRHRPGGPRAVRTAGQTRTVRWRLRWHACGACVAGLLVPP